MASRVAVSAVASLLLFGVLGALLVANKSIPWRTGLRLGGPKTPPAALPREGGMPPAARILHSQLAALYRAEPAPGDDAKKLALHSSLGRVYQDAGDYDEAIRQHSLARDLAAQSGDTEQVVATQTTLGIAYTSAGRLKESKKELEAAFLLMDRSGPNAFATMRALANVRSDSGKTDEALELYSWAQQQLEKASQAVPAENVAGLQSDIGQAYHSRGELDKALAHYKKALDQHMAMGELMGQATGAAVELAATYNHLGQALHDKGDVEHAEEYYRKALRLQQKALSKEHPSIAETLLNIARAQRDSGAKPQEALATMDWAETILRGRESVPEYTSLLTLKADLLREKGELEEAEKQSRKALDTMAKIVGSDEAPAMAISLNGLGSILHDQQKLDKAVESYLRALDINLKAVGTNHPETAATYNNIGNAYQDAGDDETAEKYYLKCLEIQKKVYGDVNPDIAASYNNIATVWVRQGRLQEAEEFTAKAVEVAQAGGLPPESPERAIYLENLQDIRSKLAGRTKAPETGAASGTSGAQATATATATATASTPTQVLRTE